MANTWIKLYHEILSDPKMGRMSDKLFRRTIEFFLLAGKEDRGGMLPDIDDIAWSLHISPKEVQTVINSLMKLNIVEEKIDPMQQYSDNEFQKRYIVKHFAERQKSDLTRSEINRAYYEKSKLKKSEIQTENKTEIQTDDSENSDYATSEIQSEIQTVDKELRIKNKNKIKEIKEKERESEIADAISAPSSYSDSTKKQHRKRGELKPFGKLKNVMLSEDEIRDLNSEMGGATAAKYIDNLSLYIGDPKNANKYKDHYVTLLRWYRKDAEDKQSQSQKVKTLADMGAEEYGGPTWDIDL